MLNFLSIFFIYTFEPSSLAAALLGPKITRSFALKISTIPSTKGASGPTIVKSIFSVIAQEHNSL